MTDAPMKAGEIFRNDQGQYSFICFHCGFAFQDFSETINHIDQHFEGNDVKWDIVANDIKLDIETPAPEFVACAKTETGTTYTDSYKVCLPDLKPTTLGLEISNVSSDCYPEVRRRGRKIEPILDTPQNWNLEERRRGRKIKPKLDTPQNCPVCELWCEDTSNHLKTAHGFNNIIYQCFICKAFFKHYIPLKNHISCTKHVKIICYHCDMEPPISNPSDPRRHKCLFCKAWFPNHIEFRIHFKDAHDKDADYFFHKRSNCNIFTCYVCEREFPLRYYLVAHMRTHHEKFLRHQCPTCGKRVRTFGQLTQHLKIHEGKTYKCSECDKVFPYFARLRRHLWCHKTELKYNCKICSKSFKIKNYLNRHMAVHDNVKKFGCRFCEATFNFTSGRRAHEKSQHKAL